MKSYFWVVCSKLFTITSYVQLEPSLRCKGERLMRGKIFVFIFIATQSTVAADTNSDLARCRTELDNLKRLVCYDSIVNTQDTTVASAKDDKSKSSSVRIEVLDSRILIQEENTRKQIYRPRIVLYPSFKNNTDKTVVAIEHTILIKDAFEDTLIDTVSKLDIKIEPNQISNNRINYWWEDNKFIHAEAFDRLVGPVSTGAAKVLITVKRAIFADGSSEIY